MKNYNGKKKLVTVILCFVLVAVVFFVLSRLNLKKTASGQNDFTYAQEFYQDAQECYVNGSRVQEPSVIKIPDSAKVTKLGEDTAKKYTIMGIAPEAFKDEKQLEEVTIPATITKIGEDAFSGCDKIKKVTFLGTEEEWSKVDIADGNESLTSVDVKCK